MSLAERRMRLSAGLLAAPALVTAFGLAAIEAYRAVDTRASIEATEVPFVSTLLDRSLGVERAYAFIRDGLDPNEPVAAQDPLMTGGAVVRASPLMLATAARNDNVVKMLLGFGARLDFPQNAPALCLARALEDEVIADILVRHMTRPAVCPTRDAERTPPLLAYLD